jgi:peptidoglycan/LPS O-acetylase OafA/YrhL
VEKQIENVQALRGVAAVSVVLFLMTLVFCCLPGIPDWSGLLTPVRDVGFAGVDAFFVISSFIIFTVCGRLTWSLGDRRGSPTEPSSMEKS